MATWICKQFNFGAFFGYCSAFYRTLFDIGYLIEYLLIKNKSMPGERAKRKLHKNENCSDSDSDFEIEMKQVSKESNRKKKKVYTSSDDSDVSLDIQSNKSLRNLKSHKTLDSDSESAENNLDVSSDEDKPLMDVVEASNGNGKSKDKSKASSSSDVDDEPLVQKGKNCSSETEEKEVDESSEDEPLINISKASKLDCKSDDMQSPFISSDEDEPLVKRRKKNAELSDYKISKNQNAKSEENGSSEEGPVVKTAKTSKMNNKSNDSDISSNVSEDENERLAEKCKRDSKFEENRPGASSEDKFAAKTTRTTKNNSKSIESDVSSNVSEDGELNKCEKDSGSEKDGFGASSEDESIVKSARPTKTNSKTIESDVSSNVSDDEKPSLSKCDTDLDSEENGVSVSSEKKPLVKKSQTSKACTSSSSSEEDDEPLAKKREKLSKTNKKNKKASNSKKNSSGSSNGDGQKATPAKPSSKKSDKKVSSDESSDDDESLASKKNITQTAKKQRNSSGSSNGEERKSNSAKSSDKKSDKKVKTNDKIEHLKKYLRVSGIHINSYDKLFADCKSIKAKTEKLLSMLHEKGLKGRPTLEKCKKLRKKIETKKEIAELDTSNIIKTEGRPKRGSTVSQKQNVESSPIIKRFSRLKDIIDSEESD